MGVGDKRLATNSGRMAGEKLGELLPFKRGGIVMVVKKSRKKNQKNKNIVYNI